MKYQEIQKLKVLGRNKRINLKMAMAPLLYDESLKKSLKNIFRGLFFVPKFYLKGSIQNAILISYNFNPEKRPDFYRIYSTTRTASGQFNELRITSKFDLKNLAKNIIKILRKSINNNNLTVNYLSRMEVICLEIYLENISKLLDEIYQSLNPKIYISFCDSYMEENVIAQFFLQLKIPTITHQHGLYRQTNNFTNGTDSEAYLNFVSDYMLVWGNKTKRELLNCGIDGKRLFVIGKIEPIQIISQNQTLQHAKKNFIIFLNGDKNFESNINLIRIGNEYSVQFDMYYSLKYHPTSNKKLYKKYLNDKFIGEINSLAQIHQNNFGLCHSSGVVIELLRSGFPTFILKDHFLDDFFDIPEFTFSNTKQLIEKVTILSEKEGKSRNIFRDIGNSLIDYYDELTITQKTKEFLSLFNEKK